MIKKDSIFGYYIREPIKKAINNFKMNKLNWWYCNECKKYHSNRIEGFKYYPSKIKITNMFGNRVYQTDGYTCNEYNSEIIKEGDYDE